MLVIYTMSALSALAIQLPALAASSVCGGRELTAASEVFATMRYIN